MLTAEKARDITSKRDNEIVNTIQDADNYIYEYSRLGFRNTGLDVNTRVAGAIGQDLLERGFKVFYTVNPHKEHVEMEIEW
jgi:CTP synthase (UTP-ammonia lyase)